MSKTEVYIVEIKVYEGESGRKKLEEICNNVKTTGCSTIQEYEYRDEYNQYMGAG